MVINFFFVFLFGIVVGSFLNVVIYRLPSQNSVGSIVFSRSNCPNCKTNLKWYDLFPIFSFIFLKGKCRYCDSKISFQYPIVEFLNGFLYISLFWFFLNSNSSLFELGIHMVLFSSLLVASVIDFRLQILPNEITIGGTVLGLILAFFTDLIIIEQALLGFVIGFVPLAILIMIKPDAMGGGDVKLMGMLGVFFGWQAVLNILIIGSITASIFNIALIYKKGNDFKEPFPFGPYLITGAYISFIILNNQLIYNYLS